MSIPLPPLPEHPEWGWAHAERDIIRARDQEIVRCVLEAAKNAGEAEKAKWPFESACTVAIEHCVSGILELEFAHAPSTSS